MPVKFTVNALAACCQHFTVKSTGVFYSAGGFRLRQCMLVWIFAWVTFSKSIFSHTAPKIQKRPLHLSKCTTKPTRRPVWPAKTQTSRYIHPVWQEFSFIPLLINSPKAVEGTCDQRRLWSDCADAQSDLSLCWSHKSYCRFCCALAHLVLIIIKYPSNFL